MKQNIILKLWQFYKPFRRYFVVILIYIFAIQGISLILPYFLAKIINAINTHLLLDALKYVAASFILAVISNSLFNTLRDYYEVAHVDFDILIHMHSVSLTQLLGLSVGQYRDQNSGIKQHVIAQGENSLSETVQEIIFDILPTIVKILFTLILITAVSPVIGIFIAVLISIYLILTIGRNINYYPKVNDWLEGEKETAKITSEMYRNAPLVILESQEEKARNLARHTEEKQAKKSKKLWGSYVIESGIYRSLINIAQYGGFALAIYLIFQGKFSAGMFVAFFGWISQAVQPVEMLTHKQRRLMILTGRIRKYFEIIEMKTDVPLPIHPRKPNHFTGKIEFKNVSYSYPKREGNGSDQKFDSISNLDFTIESGEKIGIVGESGAGKSTLVNLLRRSFDPQNGEILIDGISLKEIDLHWYRTQMGNVEQDITIFDLSIKDNIVFGLNGHAKEITESELFAVAKMASIDNFIAGLEKGFDTMIGERGIKVSGGERQRIAIARALVKNPKILIFDEATSALDTHNEELVHKSIEEAAEGRTTIIIAHRLSTVIDADRILVMDKGKLVDSGTHQELQERCLQYQKLIKHQVVTI